MNRRQAVKIKTIREEIEEMKLTEWNKNWPTNRYIVFFEHLTDIVEELCKGYQEECPCIFCRFKRFIKRLLRLD